jgi:hypothetical protein
MNPVDIAGFMPFFLALCGIGMYFLTKVLPPNFRHWCGTLTGFVLLAVFALLVFVLFQHATYPIISYIGLTGGLLVTGIGAVAAWASAGSLDPKGPVQSITRSSSLPLPGPWQSGSPRTSSPSLSLLNCKQSQYMPSVHKSTRQSPQPCRQQ